MQDYQKIYRHACDAASCGDFKTARKLYAELWEIPAWRSDPDVQRSYAYSCEKTGDYTEALVAYRKLIQRFDSGSQPSEEQNLVDESLTRLRDIMTDAGEIDRSSVINEKHNVGKSALLKKLFSHGYTRAFSAGDLICSHGEMAGHMWLLQEGAVDVILPHATADQLQANDGSVCLMGELAYFTGMRRTASLCCATHVQLIELPYERIRALMSEDDETYQLMEYLFRQRFVLHVLGNHNVFKLLSDVERQDLTMLLGNTSTQAGQTLIEIDEEHPSAYMVQNGVLLLMGKSKGQEVLLGSFHPGDVIHLGGLLRGHHASCRFVSGTPCHLLHLLRHDFEPLMMKNPWLIRAILGHVRQSLEQQIKSKHSAGVLTAKRSMNTLDGIK